LRFHAECAGCLIEGQMKLTESVRDEALRNRVVKEMCRVITGLDMERDGAPIPHGEFIRLRREMLGITDDFTEIKRRYNALALSALPALRRQVDGAEDPLRAALKLALAGNYIDFGTVKDLNEESVLSCINEAAGKPINENECESLKKELEAGGELIFLHDNCGEIVLDRLLIETIQRLYPGINVCSMVRDTPVINDVTLDDARETGLAGICEVITNGLSDMGGTPLHLLPDARRRRIESADIVIAKGMGNFETMVGCGLNVYYMFLAKCEYYKRWFGLERFTAVLENDRRLCFPGARY